MIYVLYALAAIVIVIALVVIAAALRPSEFRIARSLPMNATPARIFPYINNLHAFQEWNPYKDKDPKARNEFSGPEAGPGAVFHWTGDGNVGEGIMTIVSCAPDSRVNVDLEFLKPFPGHNAVEFSLSPQAVGTVVTWSMAGKYALFPKIVGLFINMDQMIGGDFEHGLSRLKKLVESN